jgi:archaellum component FlaC
VGGGSALASRLDALVESSVESGPELHVGTVLAATLTGLRAELEGMRQANEERLAAIEDSLDGLLERMEAWGRDGTSTATERLESVDDRLAALSQSLQSERTAAENHRQSTATSMQEHGASLDEWAEAVRSGLEELGDAVASSLGSLGATLQNSSAREADRRHLEALVTELTATVEEVFNQLADRMSNMHGDVLDGFGGARARLVEELSGTINRLEQANIATRSTVEAELTELRGDLADALEEVREHVEGTVTEANTSIASNLDAHQAASEDLRDSIHRAASNSDNAHQRVTSMQQVVERLDTVLTDLQADWRPRVDTVVAEGRAAAQGTLGDLRTEIEQTLAEMRAALSEQVATVRGASGMLGGGTDRLVSAGQALLAYLGERDRWLERERDRVLHEVLDEFAEGLSAKERKAVASRVGEALDRRRDSRDATRYRRTQEGLPAVEIPPIPEEVAALSEPVVPIKAPVRRSRPAPSTPAATKSAPPAKKAVSKPRSAKTAKKSATATKKAAPAVAKKAPAKKAASAAAPAKTAAKKAVKAPARKRS